MSDDNQLQAAAITNAGNGPLKCLNKLDPDNPTSLYTVEVEGKRFFKPVS